MRCIAAVLAGPKACTGSTHNARMQRSTKAFICFGKFWGVIGYFSDEIFTRDYYKCSIYLLYKLDPSCRVNCQRRRGQGRPALTDELAAMDKLL